MFDTELPEVQLEATINAAATKPSAAVRVELDKDKIESRLNMCIEPSYSFSLER
jgi:hypothetical protein